VDGDARPVLVFATGAHRVVRVAAGKSHFVAFGVKTDPSTAEENELEESLDSALPSDSAHRPMGDGVRWRSKSMVEEIRVKSCEKCRLSEQLRLSTLMAGAQVREQFRPITVVQRRSKLRPSSLGGGGSSETIEEEICDEAIVVPSALRLELNTTTETTTFVDGLIGGMSDLISTAKIHRPFALIGRSISLTHNASHTSLLSQTALSERPEVVRRPAVWVTVGIL